MATQVRIEEHSGSRRRFLALMGGASALAGGLSMLSACDDGVRGAEAVATPTPSASATTAAVPPSYTATDADWMTLSLQVHYLLAAYLQRGLDGSTISASLVGGSGSAGTVSGGRQASLTDPVVIATLREVTTATVARIAFLRRTLGNATSAQPAINIAGGQGSPFQAISVTAANAATATSFFDPYASDTDFLLGGVALFAVATSLSAYIAGMVSSTSRASFGAVSAAVAANDSALRNALFVRAAKESTTPPAGGQTTFARASTMSTARNSYDGPSNLDQNVGDFGGGGDFTANSAITDANGVQVRRSPEQALGVLYASSTSVSSGAFFPNGINGTIRVSGANAT